MTGEVYKRHAARRSLVQHFVYLAENARLDTADRFPTNAERCFVELAQQPEIGSPLALKRSELAGMRRWRVPDSENFLVFYLASRGRHLRGSRTLCGARLVEFAGDGLAVFVVRRERFTPGGLEAWQGTDWNCSSKR